jgi:hypothetical protein
MRPFAEVRPDEFHRVTEVSYLGFRPHDGLARMSRGFQSGVINDYVTWIVVGLACVGGALAITIR